MCTHHYYMVGMDFAGGGPRHDVEAVKVMERMCNVGIDCQNNQRRPNQYNLFHLPSHFRRTLLYPFHSLNLECVNWIFLVFN